MKKFHTVLLLVFFSVQAFPAVVNQVDCHFTHQGDEGDFDVRATYHSSVPALSRVIEIEHKEGPPSVTTESHLSVDSACGVKVNFARDCVINERLTNLGYSFAFTCGKDILSAELYCDEDCTKSTGMMSFRCDGPKVAKKYHGAGLVFLGCQFSQVPLK